MIRNKMKFTFIEFLFSLFIFSIIMIFLFSIINHQNKNNDENDVSFQNNQIVMAFDNKINNIINSHYYLDLSDNAVITNMYDTPIYLIDFNLNKKRGLINYIKSNDSYQIIDNNNTVIIDNISNFGINKLNNDLIEINFKISIGNNYKEVSEIYYLNKIKP